MKKRMGKNKLWRPHFAPLGHWVTLVWWGLLLSVKSHEALPMYLWELTQAGGNTFQPLLHKENPELVLPCCPLSSASAKLDLIKQETVKPLGLVHFHCCAPLADISEQPRLTDVLPLTADPGWIHSPGTVLTPGALLVLGPISCSTSTAKACISIPAFIDPKRNNETLRRV